MGSQRGWAIFDLDGTLVDSQPHVLWSIGETARVMGITQTGLARIGPPLKDLLRGALSIDDEVQLEEALRIFKHVHDANAGPGCRPYAGALELWSSLQAAGIRIAIATNKREEPARSILSHWHFGDGSPLLACADSAWLGGRPGKTQMVTALLAQFNAPPALTLMLGDSHEDMLAAQANQLGALLFATWGYGARQALGQPVATPHAALEAAIGFYSRANPAAATAGPTVAG